MYNLNSVIAKILNLKKKLDESYNPNILITNYCNQKCDFCFAKKLMETDKTREMPFDKYISLVKDLKNEGMTVVYLMGGEPTLHSDFKKIIIETIKLGLEIDLFTNGFFDEKIKKFLLSKGNKIRIYHINITTPGFEIKKINQKITEFVNLASISSTVSLEMTIANLNKDKYNKIISSFGDDLSNVSVRIGVDGFFLKQGGFSAKKYKQMGKLVSMLVEKLIKKGVKGVWLSEIYACMFDEKWLKKINKTGKVTIKGYGCLSKRGGLDIKTNLKIIRCFSLDGLNGFDYRPNKILKTKMILDKLMINKSKKNLPFECQKCSKHGYKEGMCPGPCLVED